MRKILIILLLLPLFASSQITKHNGYILLFTGKPLVGVADTITPPIPPIPPPLPPYPADYARVDQMIDSLKYYSIWDSLRGLWIMPACTYSWSMRNWKDTTAMPAETYGNYYWKVHKGLWSDAVYTPVKYIRTHFFPSHADLGMNKDSMCIGVFMLDSFNLSPLQGTYDGISRIYANTTKSAGTSSTVPYVNTSGGSIVLTNTGWTYCAAINRESPTTVRLYANGVKKSTVTSASNSIPTTELFLMSLNNNNTPSGNQWNRLGAYWIGKRLSDLQQTKIYEILDRYFISEMGANYHAQSEYYFETDTVMYKPMIVENTPNFKLLAQRNNMKFGVQSKDSIYFSENDLVWKRLRFVTDEKIEMAFIWASKDVTFATSENKIYHVDNAFTTITEVNLTHWDGSDYAYHTPINPAYPGRYFYQWQSNADTMFIGATEVMTFGNYCNYVGGAAPVLLYLSKDNGVSWRTAFEFGIDSAFRDNGVSVPSNSAGNYLGDTSQWFKARHVHSVAVASTTATTGTNIIATGDYTYAVPADHAPLEVRWYQGVFDIVADTYTMTPIDSTYFHCANYKNTLKSIGLTVKNDTVFWMSDWEGIGALDTAYYGVFKCKVSDITNVAKYTKLYYSQQVGMTGFVYTGNTMVCSYTNHLYISKNNGTNWYTTQTTAYPAMGAFRLCKPDNNGWYFYGNVQTLPITNGCSIRFKLK